jgi:hypothetical protein
LRALVCQTLVEKWQEVLRLQISVKMRPFAHLVAIASVGADRAHTPICLVASIIKRSIPLRRRTVIHLILLSRVVHHELILLNGLLMLQPLRLLVEDVQSNQGCLSNAGVAVLRVSVKQRFDDEVDVWMLDVG